MNDSGPIDLPLFREDIQSDVECYPIRVPDIKSGSEYYFETGSGLRYQVLFAKKKNRYLENG